MGSSVHLRPYASASGPLFGAQRSSGRQGFRSCRHWRPVVVTLRGAASGAPVNICLSEGWPTTSIPSLEERLDDHQPTRAWEHREDSGRKG
jgi:hypothetical protein